MIATAEPAWKVIFPCSLKLQPLKLSIVCDNSLDKCYIDRLRL